ncbi:MAG: hypothetical protein QOD75_2814 [Blastocatellia bacterium]|jgi:hypothetical protein|nr:hypothetical protein [Blastocatellia bacterium]
MDDNLQNYKIIVEIFKGYLDTALTVHTSYYALTGALAAYYLANRKERPYIKHALILPFLLGLTLIVVSVTGMSQALTLQVKVNEVVTGLAMPEAPPVNILRRGLLIMGVLDGVICLCLALLFAWPKFLFKTKGQFERLTSPPALTATISFRRSLRGRWKTL